MQHWSDLMLNSERMQPTGVPGCSWLVGTASKDTNSRKTGGNGAEPSCLNADTPCFTGRIDPRLAHPTT